MIRTKDINFKACFLKCLTVFIQILYNDLLSYCTLFPKYFAELRLNVSPNFTKTFEFFYCLQVLQGPQAKLFFEKSKLPLPQLTRIWHLSDVSQDGALSLGEFLVAMHLVVARRNNIPLPASLPPPLMALLLPSHNANNNNNITHSSNISNSQVNSNGCLSNNVKKHYHASSQLHKQQLQHEGSVVSNKKMLAHL